MYIQATHQLNICDWFITKLSISQIHTDKSQQSEQTAFLSTRTIDTTWCLKLALPDATLASLHCLKGENNKLMLSPHYLCICPLPWTFKPVTQLTRNFVQTLCHWGQNSAQFAFLLQPKQQYGAYVNFWNGIKSVKSHMNVCISRKKLYFFIMYMYYNSYVYFCIVYVLY
jgi:hypothetical protein